MMKRQNPKQTALKLLTWLLTEAMLTLVGLDDVAAYGEFCFGRFSGQSHQPAGAIVLLRAG